ncbi:transcriptional repressor [Spiroplasma endosymbiont of Anurida maritima]|uniref:Fur family transcriptional regulator n=1 Tax=Spiroplasma endosymbiont of Anurida maritima TaxID=2967972 RepID=UPI0036D2C2D5
METIKWTEDKIIDFLKEKGYRITEIRTSIIRLICKYKHLALTELVTLLKDEYDNVNLTSVYNSLDMLLKEHLVFTNSFDGKQIWYDIIENPSVHAVCEKCKKILHTSLNNSEADQLIKEFNALMKEHKWKPIHAKFEAHGICDNCLELEKNS